DGEEAKLFRKKYSHPLERIKFIGVWDTVGSLGIPVRGFQWLNKKYQFHDTTLSSLIENAYQALAIDERRSNFKPTLWTKSDKVTDGDVPQVMEQSWFTGVHSNVGGGYPDMGLSDITLEWMINNAKTKGLGFDEEYINTQLKPNFRGTQYNSKTGIFEFLPDYIRPVMKTENADEQVNNSVFERMRAMPGYRPENIINPVSSQLVV
ncbi:MAG: phospholipase effector Tle1 domain-containing protein, partial [Mucilaginibacter sp.]